MRANFFLTAIMACGMALAAGAGAIAQEARSEMVPLDYVAPTDPQHTATYEFAKKTRLLERASAFFTPFKLPKPLALKTRECAGDINAYYENDVITICYEYLRYIDELAKARTRPAELSETDAFLGPAIEVFLHEGAHALFEYLKIPLLGKEEDAADQLASLGLLSFGDETSRKLMAGVLHMYMVEGGYKNIRKLNRRRFAIVNAKESSDEHSTPLQRMYSALCMASGSGKPGYAELAKKAGLSPDRAELCPGEFQQVVYAFRTLLLPHIDPAKTSEMRKYEWFKAAQ